jgi:hypothetical protein
MGSRRAGLAPLSMRGRVLLILQETPTGRANAPDDRLRVVSKDETPP